MLLAQVPQTARVNKKELKAPEVAYQGEPKFEPIEKTTVSHAVNTDKDIIKVGDLYYMCFQGVWFMSKAPTGPWEVTSSVPKEIYEIPVSSPVHNVTYVTVVEDDTTTSGSTFAAVAAYTGRDDRVGLRRLGQRLVLPALLGLGRGIPLLLPALPELRLRRVVQPVDRRLRPRRRRLRSVRRRGRELALQPAHRHVLARRRGLGAVRGARLRRGLQPAHRRLRPDASGLERLRQLGHHVGAARRPVGDHLARHQQPDRRHDARDPAAAGAARPSRNARARAPTRAPSAPAAATSTPAATATSTASRTAAGRSTTTGDGARRTGPARRARRRPATGPARAGPAAPATMDQLNRDSRARSEGSQRTRDYSSYQGSGGSRSSGSTLPAERGLARRGRRAGRRWPATVVLACHGRAAWPWRRWRAACPCCRPGPVRPRGQRAVPVLVEPEQHDPADGPARGRRRRPRPEERLPRRPELRLPPLRGAPLGDGEAHADPRVRAHVAGAHLRRVRDVERREPHLPAAPVRDPAREGDRPPAASATSSAGRRRS